MHKFFNGYINKIISLVLNTFLFASSISLAIMGSVFGYKSYAHKFGSPDWTYLRMFTILSNAFNGLVCLVVVIMTVIYFKKDKLYPRWLKVLFNCGLTSVMLTFLTVLCFLGPVHVSKGGDFMYMYNGIDYLLFHMINPLITLVSYLFFFKGEKLYWYCLLYSVIPMAIYTVVYTSNVLTHNWPDFYGFTFGGKYYLTAIVIPAMLLATYLISFLINLLVNYLDKTIKK